MNLAEHHERGTGAADRQLKLEELVKQYWATVDKSHDSDSVPYSVTKTIYSLLVTTMQLSLLNEVHPGVDERRSILMDLVEAYQGSCDTLGADPSAGKLKARD